jgi:hypothetical protein
LSYWHPGQSCRRPGWRCRARWCSGSYPLPHQLEYQHLRCMEIQNKIPKYQCYLFLLSLNYQIFVFLLKC